jgi:hypothetical protein
LTFHDLFVIIEEWQITKNERGNMPTDTKKKSASTCSDFFNCCDCGGMVIVVANIVFRATPVMLV